MSPNEPATAARVPKAGNELTLKDIARMAGVSISTVSRVINRTGLVAPTKRAAVEAVLARLQYIPNNAARALIKRRTMTVGLIVPTMVNPIFAPTIAGIEEQMHAAGYGVLVACSNRDPARELEQTQMMLERGVDGLILTGAHRRPELLPLVRGRGVMAVLQDCPSPVDGVVTVAMQDAAAMAAGVDALVGRGHRRIAVVTGPTSHTLAIAERVRGARERLAAHGITLTEADIAETPDYEAAPARAAARRMLARRPAYTAIACTGDVLALGVIMECRRAGLSVPDDISILGCGDTVMGQYVDPPLTTVHLPFHGMGRAAARQMVALLSGRKTTDRHLMEYRLVERDSVRTL